VELEEREEWRRQVEPHQVLVEMSLLPLTKQVAMEELDSTAAMVVPVLHRHLLTPLMEAVRPITFFPWPNQAVAERAAELAVTKTVGRPVMATAQTGQTLRVR
jgi:hypothetical protein